MSFLRLSARPLAATCASFAAPRPVLLRRFLSAAPQEAASTVTSSSASPSSPSVAAAVAAQVRSSHTPEKLSNLPYHVERSMSSQLPIYLETKRGGNFKQTRLRKIHGDIGALKEDIRLALQLKKYEITINQVTKHILIKGWYKPQLQEFLTKRNF